MRRLCATVLVMEAVVIWLAIPVALAVEHASPRSVGIAGGVLAVAAVVLAALARRRLRWTLVGGSVLQALVIAGGAIVPVMYFLGTIFAALWVIAILLARRVAAASQDDRTQGEGPAADNIVTENTPAQGAAPASASAAPAPGQARAGTAGHPHRPARP